MGGVGRCQLDRGLTAERTSNDGDGVGALQKAGLLCDCACGLGVGEKGALALRMKPRKRWREDCDIPSEEGNLFRPHPGPYPATMNEQERGVLPFGLCIHNASLAERDDRHSKMRRSELQPRTVPGHFGQHAGDRFNGNPADVTCRRFRWRRLSQHETGVAHETEPVPCPCTELAER